MEVVLVLRIVGQLQDLSIRREERRWVHRDGRSLLRSLLDSAAHPGGETPIQSEYVTGDVRGVPLERIVKCDPANETLSTSKLVNFSPSSSSFRPSTMIS
jgi:hypothetical protein